MNREELIRKIMEKCRECPSLRHSPKRGQMKVNFFSEDE